MSRAPVAAHVREEVLAAAQTGASYLSIAKRYGISERAIRNWADDAGMLRRRSGQPAPDDIALDETRWVRRGLVWHYEKEGVA